MNNNEQIQVLKFEKNNIPKPNEMLTGDRDKMVNYGANNLYPDYLLHLYNSSPIHSAIINAKATYITGDGLKGNGNDNDTVIYINDEDSFSEFVSKCMLDYLIFNAFAVEVIYNSFGEVIEYYWIPVHKVRTNQSKTHFWYSEDWRNRNKPTRFDRFKAGEDNSSEIFYFDGYFPSPCRVYPIPEYTGCITSISTDVSIRDFNLNNIKNQFSVSTLITFFNGSNIPDEVKKQVVKDIKASYTGENGKKIIVDFQNSNGKSADVRNISPGDWDKAYIAIGKNVADDIYRGHQVTSPMLMGVKTEGQLGGATELETAYEIFKNTYVRKKRSELEGAFNYLFNSQLSFTDKPLFSSQLSDNLKQQVYTINELRKEAGLPARANGNRLLSEPVSVEAEKQESKSDWIKHELKEEDFDKVKHLGSNKSDFDVIGELTNEEAAKLELQFDKQGDIATWIMDNDINRIGINDLKRKLSDAGISVTIGELRDIIQELSSSGIIKVNITDKGNVTVRPDNTETPAQGTGVQVLYDYVKRPDVSGSTIIPTSRGFCKRLVENNKYYSRKDIQAMSRLFGYNVWLHCGGYWYSPETDETYTHCRHMWKPVQVKRKQQG